MCGLKCLSYKKAFLSLVVFTLLEPFFELLCLLLHNFVFQMVASLSFASVSLPAFLLVSLGFIKTGLLWQYLLSLWGAFLLAIFIAIFRLFNRASMGKIFIASFLVWAFISGALFYQTYALINWHEIISWLSFGLSSFYWFSSVGLTYIILRLIRIL